MDRLIHTPEGVRDVYNQECTKKLYLENQIEQVFHAFGYQDIETPTFEFLMYSEEKWEQHRPASSTNSLTATATPLCSVRTLPRRLHVQLHVFHGRDDADPPLLQRKQLRQQQQLSGPLKRVHPDGRRALKR